MGAMSFYETGKGRNAREVYNALCEEAIAEYGHDGYNGTISTTMLRNYQQRTIAKVYTKQAEKDAYEYAMRADFGEKWTADYLDLGVCEYLVRTIKKVRVPKDAPKYEMRYVVMESNADPRNTKAVLAAVSTKEEAEKIATDYGMTHRPDVSGLSIYKRKWLVSGTEEVERFEISTKSYQKKPARLPKGATVEEIHMYAFYGWAAC